MEDTSKREVETVNGAIHERIGERTRAKKKSKNKRMLFIVVVSGYNNFKFIG